MRLTKAERLEMEREQEYIKEVRAVFSSLKFLGNGKVTSGDIKDDFDRLKISRAGRLFAVLLQEAIDGGMEVVEGESTRKPSVPSEELFGGIFANA
jgi:tRNA-dihydrouridine synthase